MELPKDQSDQSVQTPNTGSNLNLSATPAPQKSGKKLYLILAIFLIAALIGGGAFYFLKSSDGGDGSESIPSLKKASGGLQGKLEDQELFLKIKPKKMSEAGDVKEMTKFTFNADNKGLYLFFPNKDMSFKEIRDSIVSVDNKEEIQVMFAQWNPELDSDKGQWMATEQNYYDKSKIKELESEPELDGAVVKKGQGVVIMAPTNIIIPNGHDSSFSAGTGYFDWRDVKKGWILLSAHGDTFGKTFKDDCLNRVSTVFVQNNAKTANMAEAFVKVDLTNETNFQSTNLKDNGFYAVWVYVNDQKCGEKKKITASFTVTGITTVPTIITQNTAQDQTVTAAVSGTNLTGDKPAFDANPRFNGSTTSDTAITITQGTGNASETNLPLSISIKKGTTPGIKNIVFTSKEGVTQTASFTIQPEAPTPKTPEAPAPKTLSAPGKPTGTAGDGKVTLTWTEPTEKGESNINNYLVTVKPTPNNEIATRSVGSTQKTFTFTGLNNDTAYTFTVKAQNGQGFSPDSQASDPITPISLAPIVTGITPYSAKRGTSTPVTIKGNNLNAGTTVLYEPDYSIGALNNDIEISNVNPSQNGNSITLTITVPDSAFFGSKPIEINTAHGSYNGKSTLFTVEASQLEDCPALAEGDTLSFGDLLYNPTISNNGIIEEDTEPFAGGEGEPAHFVITSSAGINLDQIIFEQGEETIDAKYIQKGKEMNLILVCATTFNIAPNAFTAGAHTITAKANIGEASASTEFEVQGMTSINPISWTFPLNGEKITMENRKFQWNHDNPAKDNLNNPVTYNYRWGIVEGNLTDVEEFKKASQVWTKGWDPGSFGGGDDPACRKEDGQKTIWICPYFTLPTDTLDSLKSDTIYTVGAQIGNGTIASEYSLTTFTISNPQKELDAWLKDNPLSFEVGGKDGLAIESQNHKNGDVNTYFDIILDKTKTQTGEKTFTVDISHTYPTGGANTKFVVSNQKFKIKSNKEFKNIDFSDVEINNGTSPSGNIKIPITIKFSDWNYWNTIPFTMNLTDENGATATFNSTYNGLKGPKLEVEAGTDKMYYNGNYDELGLWIKNVGPGLIPVSMLDKINLSIGHFGNGSEIDDLITKQLLLCSNYYDGDNYTNCMNTSNDGSVEERKIWSNINWNLMRGQNISYEGATEIGWVKDESIMLYLHGIWAGDHELRFRFWHEIDGFSPKSFGGNTPYTFTTND